MSTFVWKPFAAQNKYQKANKSLGRDDLNMTQNLVDPEWETLDPTPDIFSLFQRFDSRFFQSKLQCVELEWSKRMYSCAGICYMRRTRVGQSVIIRLSEPLLKLRQRKDLVETLLHEMIHAFSFIRGIREGNGGHGPFFHQMMNDINKRAGTNISVYHTFHDEVNVYKKHVWRCNGICTNRKPFFGYVRRVSNRAPGPNDLWWKSHMDSCGGLFKKVSEPDKVAKKKTTTAEGGRPRKKEPVVDKTQPKINDMFGGSSISSPPSSTLSSEVPDRPKVRPGGNIRGFSDINSDSDSPSSTAAATNTKVTPPVSLYTGPGNSLLNQSIDREIQQFKSIQEQVRNSWQKRFGGGTLPDCTGSSVMKKQRLDSPGQVHQWQVLDTDIAIRTPYVEVIDLLDSDTETEDTQLRDHNERLTEMANKSVKERRSLVRKELFDEGEVEGEDIELIDDEFDDAQQVGGGGGGGSSNSPGNIVNGFSAEEVVKCPICEGGVARGYLSQHMEEGCLGITQKVAFVFNRKDPDIAGPSSSFSAAGPSTSSSHVSSPPRPPRDEQRYPCPNCGMRYSESRINEHLDECLV